MGRREAAISFLERYEHCLREQGSVVATWRERNGRKTGPYHRLTCRDASGTQRSVYLGSDSNLVGVVQEMLSMLKQRRRESRALARARPVLRRALRASRRELDHHLASVGLVRKGAEVRGWPNYIPEATSGLNPASLASIREENSEK